MKEVVENFLLGRWSATVVFLVVYPSVQTKGRKVEIKNKYELIKSNLSPGVKEGYTTQQTTVASSLEAYKNKQIQISSGKSF